MSLTIQTEREFQAAIVEYAKLTGWLVYHPHDSRKSEPGFPDLTMVRGPRVVFAELKVSHNKTTPEQRKWLDALAVPLSTETYVWYPDDWSLIEGTLR